MKTSPSFFQAFLRNWRQVGSVVPSSRFLATALVRPINFSTARLVVELGPGDGAITKMILRQLAPSGQLIALEVNQQFCHRLADWTDTRLTICQASALQLAEQLAPASVDAVISGLPLANFSLADKLTLWRQIRIILKPGGQYLQFQYSLEAYPALQRQFSVVQRRFVPWNLPPAFVYHCRH